MGDFFEIASGGARAWIALRGAELKSWDVGGSELLWRGDATFWDESAPILFPVVGWTRDGVRVAGRRYPLGLHGFARSADFSLLDQERDRVRLRLRDNDLTRTLYPFQFSMIAEYTIEASQLSITLDVLNEDSGPLPFACGLHPGFVWPLPGACGPHRVRFDEEEQADVPVIAPGGLFSALRRAIPMRGRDLRLSPDLFEEALCFLDARSAGLDYFAEDGPRLRMELENFPHIALWSRRVEGRTAPFLCLEAWTGHGDPEGFSGDLFAKPSMRVLAPGESARSGARFIWRP